MAINPYDKWPQLDIKPLDFDFLLRAQAYQDQRADLAGKNLDEVTGMLATLNPAPGNIEWGTKVINKYNNSLNKVVDEYGKVPIQKTISDARRIKAGFLADPEVKTLLNNKDYYDKVLSPYLANKESKYNVNMMPYLDSETGQFKPNELSYAGSLSYVPYQNVGNFIDGQLQKVEYQLAEDMRSRGMQIFTEPTTNLKYYMAGGERKYIRNEESFKPAVESTVDILMSGQTPEGRFLKADAEWKQPGSFNRDYVRNVVTPYTTKYFGQKAEGQPNIGWVPGQSEGASGGTGGGGASSEGVSTIDVGNVPMAIIEGPEQEQINSFKAAQYKTNKPEFINDVFANIQKDNIQLQNWTPQDLKISRTYNPKDNQVQYNVGLTEDEFVAAAPANVRDQAKQQYRNMQIEFNSQALKEQAQLNLYQKAVENVNNKIFGTTKKPGEPGYNPDSEKARSEMQGFFDVVENYKNASPTAKQQLNKMLFPLLESFYEANKQLETDEDGEWRFSGTGNYRNANPEDAWSTRQYYQQLDSIEKGVIPEAVKKSLYREMGKNPRYKPLKSYSENFEPVDPATGMPKVGNKKIEEEYRKLYEQDQMKSYKIISYDLPSTPDKETSYLGKLQQNITQGLKSNLTVTDKGRKVYTPGSHLENYVYYTPGSDKVKSKSWNAKELFNEDTEFKGVDIQGVIYDRESGFWWVGNLKGNDDIVGEKVLVRPENHQEFTNTIINNMSLNPGTGETLNSIKVVLESMPISDVGVTAVRKIDEGDTRVQKVFDAFGMTNVYISGNDANGYDISFKSRIPGVVTDPQTNKIPIQHYNSIADLSAAISKHGQLYNTFQGKK